LTDLTIGTVSFDPTVNIQAAQQQALRIGGENGTFTPDVFGLESDSVGMGGTLAERTRVGN
jgi:hypothetical protein